MIVLSADVDDVYLHGSTKLCDLKQKRPNHPVSRFFLLQIAVHVSTSNLTVLTNGQSDINVEGNYAATLAGFNYFTKLASCTHCSPNIEHVLAHCKNQDEAD